MEYIIKTSEISSLKRLNASTTSAIFQGAVNSASNEGVTVINADGVEVTISAGRFQSRASLYRLDAELMEKELEAAVKRFLNRLTGNMGKMIY